MSDVSCVLPARALLGEGPLWDAEDRALYWVDIKGCMVHRFDPATGRDAQWPMPEVVGCLARRAAGGLVVALRSGFHFLDLDTGAIQAVATPEEDRPENRFNDGKPDRRGRFWAGSMHDPETAPTGALYRLDPDGACHRMVDGVVISNALCWSPDGRTMYHADTSRRVVWAWDSDPDRGEIANRRVFVKLSGKEGAPDGATVDAEGFVWLAHWGGWQVTRHDPTGRMERVVRLPVERPSCPAFGGPDLATLFVTSASIGLSAEALAAQPYAGGILAFEPGVRGLPEARFLG
ncbi:MAG TPA: SMP-30/gluconolactonase/LRE family protein [Methylomirabilota bacterium]